MLRLLLSAAFMLALGSTSAFADETVACPAFLDHDLPKLHSKDTVNLCDVAAGKPVTVPANYYPEDDPARPPANRWRSHAHLLYGNWINEIYQTTEYDMSKIGSRTGG